MAQEYSPNIRVNALAPGFFLTEQNRYLLHQCRRRRDTARADDRQPYAMRATGRARDLAGTLLWLASPAAAFVTGVVIPVDGGFAAFSGV